jgi:GNAT superfamily N-acetyltransferase
MFDIFSFEKKPTENEINIVKKGLDDFNFKIVENDNHRALAIIVKNNIGKIIGGILGGTYWNWLYIERLWITEDHRGKGLGKKLLNEIEKEAFENGCQNAHLETHDFQALKFYLKNGYKKKFRLKNLPVGHSKYFLVKRLNGRI